MASKLTEISTQYHTFVDNQVLTKTQLNELVNYFDDQDRLTRVFLNGVGTVCGFRLGLSAGSVSLSPGVAVTTDGDLLQLKNAVAGTTDQKLLDQPATYAFYRPFDDDKAHYQAFRRVVFATKIGFPDLGRKFSTRLLPLFDLLTEPEPGAKPLTDLTGWNEMAALLYLECYENKERCSAVDCDNQGLEQVNRLRVLLLPKNDAEYLAQNDPVFSVHDVFDDFAKLPAVAVRRVVLTENNTLDYGELRRAYQAAIAADGLVKSLSEGITQLVQNFGSLLGSDSLAKALPLCLSRFNAQFSFSAYRVPFDIQYRYDQLKDLVDTYSEIRELLLGLKTVCMPGITAFPKHILLGLLNETETEPKQLRHRFYPSPAADACDQLEKGKSLLARLFAQISSYGIQSGDIKITPSVKYGPLGTRAIPFYYQVDDDLLKAWDYGKTKRFGERFNLSYHTGLLAPQQQQPLLYNADAFDFYRIEGHQGRDYRDVLDELTDQSKQYGLNFDVKALSVNLNTDTIDPDDYACEFEDLKVLLKAWTTEQDCILAQVSDFFSNYSLVKPGTNLKYTAIDAMKNLSAAAGLAAAKAAVTVPTAKRTVSSAALNLAVAKNVTLSDSKVVEENLSTAADTLGATMKKAFDASSGGSANDIIASAKADLAARDLVAWNDTDPDTKDLLLDNSVSLLAYTQVLSKRMPIAVNLIDKLKVQDYKLTLSQLCSLVQKLKLRYESSKLDQQMKAYVGLLINQLSTVCCSGKKLEVLLDEVNNRKEQILLRLQLSAFIDQHPGMEHKAGVEPGGTFVIVYKNPENKVSATVGSVRVMASSLLASAEVKATLASSKVALSEKLLNAETLSSVEKTAVLRDATALLKAESLIDRISIREGLDKFLPVLTVPDNTVVADFSLPYRCCSGCSSINYIVQKPAATLRLSRDRYCLLTDTDPIWFTVSPNDGIVRAEPEISGLVIGDGRIVLNADAFPDTQLGLPIRFTVDNQVTDAILMVFPGIKADFNVPAEPTNERTFRFVATGENLDGASWFWQFGDGNSSALESPTHTYTLPVNDENKVTVSLLVTAANGVCKHYTEHPIQFEAVQTTIGIEKSSFCANDKTEYPFTVTPAGAKVEIAGSGVMTNNAGGFSFIPAVAGAGTVAFLLNGEPSGVEVKVELPPRAAFTPAQTGNQLVLTNDSKNALKFTWTINGAAQQTDTTDPVVIDLQPDSPTEWKIALEAAGADVCPASRATGSLTTKYVEPVSNCVDEAKAAIVSDAKRLAAITAVLRSDMAAEYLNRTRALYGGTADFKAGVLDRVDAFLSGEANANLQKLFEGLLTDTAMMIVEMSGNAEVQKQLITLFELQLRLFYNVLGCQSDEILKKYADPVNVLLQLILKLLTMLKDKQITYSNTMKAFVKAYAEKVVNALLLGEHLKLITGKQLI